MNFVFQRIEKTIPQIKKGLKTPRYKPDWIAIDKFP